MSENFSNLTDIYIKIQEAQRAPNKLKPNRPMPRHIIIKNGKLDAGYNFYRITRNCLADSTDFLHRKIKSPYTILTEIGREKRRL